MSGRHHTYSCSRCSHRIAVILVFDKRHRKPIQAKINEAYHVPFFVSLYVRHIHNAAGVITTTEIAFFEDQPNCFFFLFFSKIRHFYDCISSSEYVIIVLLKPSSFTCLMLSIEKTHYIVKKTVLVMSLIAEGYVE